MQLQSQNRHKCMSRYVSSNLQFVSQLRINKLIFEIMRKSIILVIVSIVIFLLILEIAEAQRGGGGRSGGSRSRSRSYSSKSSKSGKSSKGKKSQFTALDIIIIAIFIGVGLIPKLYEQIWKSPQVLTKRQTKQQKQSRRQLKIQSAIAKYYQRFKEIPCSLTPEQKEKIIGDFWYTSFSMVIELKDKSQVFHCSVKVTQLVSSTINNYKIGLSGKDEVGNSQFQGILIFRTTGLAVFLSKVYEDRVAAGQTDNYDILFYEGEGTFDRLQGKWAFNGYQNSNKYSGSWQMSPNT